MMLAERFEVLEEIGRGPLGKVLRALERPSGRPVALRIIDEPVAVRAEALLATARRAAAIQHPNVVRVLDCGREARDVWIAMELVAGRTLARVLEEDGPLDAGQLVRVAMELCAGLEAGHQGGIVHRDLKPANVIVNEAGIKLMDLGLAHARARAGTAPYVSPEARHGYPVDERSDLYSLGVLLVELATGLPFDEDPDAPLVLGANVPAPLTAVLLRLLHKDRGARFRSAAAVAAALQACVGKGPPAPTRRRLRALGVGAAIAFLGVAGILVLSRGRAGAALPELFVGCQAGAATARER
jgi:eukaryotic-like serine/threonine-protein kinase